MNDCSISESGLVSRFTLTVTLGVVDGLPTPMSCAWAPRVPRRGELTRADLRAYQAIRDRTLARFTQATRIRIAVLEV